MCPLARLVATGRTLRPCAVKSHSTTEFRNTGLLHERLSQTRRNLRGKWGDTTEWLKCVSLRHSCLIPITKGIWGFADADVTTRPGFALPSTLHKQGWPLCQAVFTRPGWRSQTQGACPRPKAMVFARDTPLGRLLNCADSEEHQVSSKTAWIYGGRWWPKGHTGIHRGSEADMREPGPPRALFPGSVSGRCPQSEVRQLWAVKSMGWKWLRQINGVEMAGWKWLRLSCSDSHCIYGGSCCQEPFSDAQTPEGTWPTCLWLRPLDLALDLPRAQPWPAAQGPCLPWEFGHLYFC